MEQHDTLHDWMLVFAVFLVLAIFLGIAAFIRPAVVQVKTPIPYQHTTHFSYTARAPEGLYDLPQVQPGEPIFTQLTGTLTVSCAYHFTAEAPYQVKGTYQLLARVSDSRGWKRTLPLTDRQPFDNGTFQAKAVVHLEDLQAFIDELQAATGIHSGTYTLSIIAHVESQGEVGGMPFQETVEPALAFRWDGKALVVPHNSKHSPFLSEQGHALVRLTVQPNSLMILGQKVPVSAARTVSVVAGALSLLLLVWAWREAEHRAQTNLAEYLRLVEGVAVVAVQEPPATEAPPTPLKSLDDVAGLAKTYRRPVLYLREGEKCHFWVQTPEAVYQYTTVQKPLANPRKAWRLSLRQKSQPATSEDALALVDVALSGWAQAVDAQTVNDPLHSQRVADLAQKIGQALGLSPDALRSLKQASWLHALGLMDIPPEIVQKRGPLTESEQQVLREHARRLNARFATAEQLRDALRMAYYRPERWDGSGYPEGLSGEDIPLGARILAVADAWDALRHDRPYRNAWPPEAARRFMQQKAGQWFDPAVVDALFRVLDHGETPPEEDENGPMADPA